MKKLLKRKALLLTLTAPLLVACHPFVQYPYNQALDNQVGSTAAVGAATGLVFGEPVAGAVVGAGVGAYAHSTVRWLKKLQADGVQVIQAGYLVTIVVPSDKIFIISTDSILPQSYPILNDVSQFIKNYGRVKLTVNAYTDNVGGTDASLELSIGQAKSVLAYLWSTGIPSGSMTAVGHGQDRPVADNIDSIGSAMNRRVEIRFAYTPPKMGSIPY